MGWIRRLRGTMAGSDASRDFEEETRFHLEELVDELVARGVPPDDARRLAQRRLGNLAAVRDRTRDADTFRWLTDAARDLRFAGRSLRRQPAFAVVAILTLALGIGANTAIFTLVDAILLRSLPVRDPSRLVLFDAGSSEGTSTGSTPSGQWTLFSSEVYRDLRRQPLGFDGLAAVRSGEAAVLVHVPGAPSARAERAQAHLVSGNYFTVMGVGAAIGRTFTDSDDTANAPPVVVVSDTFWRQHLNASPAIVGRTVVLNATSFTVAGVTPPEFFGERVRRAPDFWVPLAFQPAIELRASVLEQSDWYWLNLIGRLAPGVSMAQARTAATAALQRFLTANAGSSVTHDRAREIQASYVELSNGASGISGLRFLYSQPLHVLLAVVVLVLFIACANVANLLLTRAASRRSEISMRIALGAGRARLVRQLLTESLLLAGIGAACGVLLAGWVARGLMTLVASPTSPVRAAVDGPVLAFTVAIALGAGLLFGIAPALYASRLDLITAMKTRQGSGAAGSSRSATGALVAVQIAVSLVLLVGAGLFARTLVNVEQQPLGFDAAHVLLARVNPRLAGYTPQAATALYRRLYDRLGALPGVRAATMARYSPFGGGRSRMDTIVEGYTPRPDESMSIENIQVGPSYPETLGMRVVQGRAIGIHDAGTGAPVAMVNEAFVRQYLPGVNPIGRHIGLDPSKPPDLDIVGVLADARFRDAREAVSPIVFTAMLQESSQFALDCEFAVRTAGDPAGAAAEVRSAMTEVDANLPVNDPRPLAAQVSAAFNSERLAARLIALFGFLALTLAAVGLYGAVAQNVVHRTNEIGVRMALGAERSGVLWLIVRQVCVLVAAGVLVGLPVSVAAARLVSSQLFGVHAIDALSFAGAVGALAVVAAAAGLVPALRATRVDPVVALRAE